MCDVSIIHIYIYIAKLKKIDEIVYNEKEMIFNCDVLKK